jgi:hypothetical protein
MSFMFLLYCSPGGFCALAVDGAAAITHANVSASNCTICLRIIFLPR